MPRPVDALVTGFSKAPAVIAQSFAPLRRLRQEDHLRAIHYVTWDDPSLDGLVAPVAAMGDVTVSRVPQPKASGTAGQRGVVYQIENLRAGLQCLPRDGLIFKQRPDFVISHTLLRDKITGFDRLCPGASRTAPNGVAMPAPVFANKMWLPWADACHPFFYEDAAFLATARDAALLVTDVTAHDLAFPAQAIWGPYAHVVRYARIFLEAYPLFANYLRNYRFFVNDFDYRMQLVPFLLDDGFYWHAIVAHAWILFSHFHIDAGAQGDIQLYANNCNERADWSDLSMLKSANPYDKIDMWRTGSHPGQALPSVSRVFCRLVDDAWQTALFTQTMPDFPPETLRSLMENIAHHHDGRLGGIEHDFYDRLAVLNAAAWPLAKAG